MTENEAIYCLKAESDRYSEVCEECPLYGKVGCDHCFEDAIDVVIKALEELQMYKQGGLCLVPTDAYKKQCEELDSYKEIGTVEEFRFVVEKQKPKKVLADVSQFICPVCKSMDIEDYDTIGGSIKYKYCPNCGQKLDWQ